MTMYTKYKHPAPPSLLFALALSGLLLRALPAQAQVVQNVGGLEGVGITEHLDAQLPLDAAFKDETGKDVLLGDYFDGKRPVILNLIYFNCPMLCSLVVNGMVDGLKELDWGAGQEFDILTVSFNPLETPTLAKLKQQNYIKYYARPSAQSGWHFLTGSQESITRLTQTVGFEYKWDEQHQQFAHAAAIFMISPEGHVTRYLYGVQFKPKDLKLALIEASKGKLGSTLDRVMFYCYHYDTAAGTYAPVAMNIMRLGGALTVALLAIVLGALWANERRKRRHTTSGGTV